MWLETTAKERALEFEEILGYHLEQAFHYRQRVGALDDATRLVGRRAPSCSVRPVVGRSPASTHPPLLNLISRAIALVPAGDPLQVDLVPSVRAMQGIEVDWAQSILENAMAVGEPRLQAHAAVQQGFLRLFFVESDVGAEELITVANDAIALFSDVGDDLRARARVEARRPSPTTSQDARQRARMPLPPPSNSLAGPAIVSRATSRSSNGWVSRCS